MTDEKLMVARRRLFKGAAASGLVAAGLVAAATPSSAATVPVPVLDISGKYPMPFRTFDSRETSTLRGGGRFSAGNLRTVSVDFEDQPANAALAASFVSLNIIVVDTVGSGYLTIYPADMAARPTASCINWTASNQTIASSIMTRCQATVSSQNPVHQGLIKVYCGGGGSAQVILDLTCRWVTQDL